MDNSNKSSMGGIQGLFDWIAKLAYLNILWLLASVVGLIIFGIGPATISAFTVIRKRLREGEGFSIWKLFIETYRKEFWQANKLMLLIVPVALFIYFDFVIIQSLPYNSLIDYIVFPALILFSILFMVVSSYLFAVYVHFDISIWTNIKYAFIFAGLYPLSTIMIVGGLFIFGVILFIFPAIIPFYAISIPVLLVQSCANRSFRKVASAQKAQNNKLSK